MHGRIYIFGQLSENETAINIEGTNMLKGFTFIAPHVEIGSMIPLTITRE